MFAPLLTCSDTHKFPHPALKDFLYHHQRPLSVCHLHPVVPPFSISRRRAMTPYPLHPLSIYFLHTSLSSQLSFRSSLLVVLLPPLFVAVILIVCLPPSRFVPVYPGPGPFSVCYTHTHTTTLHHLTNEGEGKRTDKGHRPPRLSASVWALYSFIVCFTTK